MRVRPLVIGVTALTAAIVAMLWGIGVFDPADPARGQGGIEDAVSIDADDRARRDADAKIAEAAGAADAAARRRDKPAARVIGRLIDPDRRAFRNARVELRRARGTKSFFTSLLTFTDPKQFNELEDTFKMGDVEASTTVAADGAFAFEDAPSGRWELAVVAPVRRLAESVVFELSDDATVDLGAIATVAAPSLLVIVSDAEGRAVMDAQVGLFASFDPMQFANPERLADINGLIREFIPVMRKTDKRGTCRFDAIRKAGTYQLLVKAARNSPSERVITCVDGLENVVRVRMGRAASLEVSVVDKGGKAVEHARVAVRPVDPRGKQLMFSASDEVRRARKRSDAKGLVAFDSLWGGPVKVNVRARGYLQQSLDLELKSGHLSKRVVRLDPGETIRGRVVDQAGKGIAKAKVGHVPELGQTIMGFDVGSFLPDVAVRGRIASRGATTDDDGNFELRGLEKGDDLWLVAYAEDYSAARLGPIATGSDGHEIELDRLVTIRGKAVRAEDGEAVEGVEAWCAKSQFLVFEGRLGRSRSEKSGAFVLSNIQPGSHTLVLIAPGRSVYRKRIRVDDKGLDLGELRLEPAASISGVVVDESGKGIEGAEVRLSKGGIGDYAMLAKMRGDDIAKSDEQGRFRLEGVPARRCRLFAEKPGFASKRSSILKVLPGKELADVRIVLGRGGSALGLVVDADGKPQPGWQVSIKSDRLAVTQMRKSDAQGRVRFDGLTPGSYIVQAMAPDFFQSMASFGQAQSDTGKMPNLGKLMAQTMRSMLQTNVRVRDGEQTEFKLVREQEDEYSGGGCKLTGTITVGGEVLESGFVEFLDLGAALGVRLAEVQQGRFELPAMQPGSYRVRVRAGFYGAASPVEKVFKIPSKAKTHRVTIALPGGSIEGRVLKADGQPAVHALVKIASERDRERYNGTRVEDVGQGVWLTDAKGRFRFAGLVPGEYSVHVGSLAMGQGKASAAVLRGIRLAQGERKRGLEVRLASGGTIDVVVEGSAGPEKQALLRLLDEKGMPVGLLQPVLTDAQGRASFRAVAAGRYRVLADGRTFAPTSSELVAVESGTAAQVAIRVKNGVAVELEVEGELPSTSRNEVVAYSVWTLEGRLVRAGPAPAALLAQRAKAAKAKGRGIAFGSLAPGRYRVRFESRSLGLVQREVEVPNEAKTVWVLDIGARSLSRKK